MPITTNLKAEEIRSLESAIVEYLKDLAVRKGIVKSREEATVRDILPATDLGFSHEDFTVSLAAANAWNTVVSLRLPDKKALAIYGARLTSASPITSAIKFALGPGGAKTKEIVEVEQGTVTEEREVIFEKPILYEDSQYAFIQYYAKAAGSDRVVLLGFVVEPAGEVISS